MSRVAAALIFFALAAPASAADRYGDLTFPRDEHQKLDGWNYWWGAADLVTESGNEYTLGFAYDSFYGIGAAGHQLFPRQGPMQGQALMTADGPAEWGHPGDGAARFLYKISVAQPGRDNLPYYHTLDTRDRLRDIGSLVRTSADQERYRLRIDNKDAKWHPSGERKKFFVDLDTTMNSPPLLLGGTGTWWYGIPQTYKYPSRSFQYMQAAQRLTGTLAFEQPDGTVVREKVVPSKSTLTLVREYDANPEDLFLGLALAESTQLHPRYAQYYSGGMPWELIFVDLGEGVQLMFATLAFHESEKGTIKPVVGPEQPTYQVLATIRLPSGESIPIDNALHVEHLSYRTLTGNVPTFAVQVKGIWRQSWAFRVKFGGGSFRAGDGTTVDVPPFDLGLEPNYDRSDPAPDAAGNRLTQRVPIVARGSYDGCPVRGFGWSELIINWYEKESVDPWWSGGQPPRVPASCDDPIEQPPVKPTGALTPVFGQMPPPTFKTREGRRRRRLPAPHRVRGQEHGRAVGLRRRAARLDGHHRSPGAGRADRHQQLGRAGALRLRHDQAGRPRRPRGRGGVERHRGQPGHLFLIPSGRGANICSPCGIGQIKFGVLGAGRSSRLRVLLEARRSEPTGLILPAVSPGVRPRVLRSQPREANRPGRYPEAGGPPRAHEAPPRVLRRAPVHGLRGGRSGRPRVRPSP